MSEGPELNTHGLDQLLKLLKAKPPVARVGILGGKTSRSSGGRSNAEIGAAHEFGTSQLPQRSFLRIPISDNLQKAMEEAGAFDENTTKEVLAAGTVVPWLKKIAIIAEGIVADAFSTGGFGKWVVSDMRRKKVAQTLVETQQLRSSITSEVRE